MSDDILCLLLLRPGIQAGDEIRNRLEITGLYHTRVMVAARQGLPDFRGGFGELVEFTHVRGPRKRCQRESRQRNCI